MERIQAQANKLWQIISSPSTAKTYQQALALTWSLLKETGQLLWLVLCLGLVAGDWFWKKSYKAGQDTRVWIDTLQTKATTPDPENEAADKATSAANFLSETGKSLLSAGQNSVTLALNTAKAQLGMEIKAPPAKPASVATPPASPKVVAPSVEPAVTSEETIVPAETTPAPPIQIGENE